MRARHAELEIASDIKSDVPHILIGDSGRLRQIVVNLIGNALKFTEKGEVVLSVDVLARQDEHVDLRFAVRDTGIGIPPEKQDTIFRAFEQVDSTLTRQVGGTGLGLAICRRLTELMNGRIWVESGAGEGSVFYFTGRFSYARDDQQPQEVVPVELQGMHALVVDDNDTSRRILTDMLHSWELRRHRSAWLARHSSCCTPRTARHPLMTCWLPT